VGGDWFRENATLANGVIGSRGGGRRRRSELSFLGRREGGGCSEVKPRPGAGRGGRRKGNTKMKNESKKKYEL